MIFNVGESSTDSQINRLIEAVNESMAELETNIQAQIDELSAAIAGASFNAVKSVQRGIIESNTKVRDKENFRTHWDSPMSFYIDVTINPVSSINKCFVYTNESEFDSAMAIPKLINNSTLRIYVGSGSTSAVEITVWSAISWQVVEYY